MAAESSSLPRTIAVTGAGGMVGTALQRHLADGPVRILRLVRRPAQASDEIAWNPRENRLDPADLRPADAVVHLAGESIAALRWTEEKKRRILQSRRQGTDLLARAMAAADGPRILVSASGLNYYGDRGDERLTEESPPGEGFLASVAQAWEASTAPAAAAGIRVVRLRFGLILSPTGGFLQPILPLFRLGLGATLGSGQQWMSWITLRDVVRLIETALADHRYAGSLNAMAPNPVTNAEFTRLLGRALGRPTLLAVPRPVLELVMGELARDALLASTRAVPARLEELGFPFQDRELGPALERLVKEGMRA